MVATHYVWDPEFDCITKETSDAGAVTARYTQEPKLYGGLISQNRSGSTSIYHYDASGTTRALTDSNQAVTDTAIYTAFGEKTASVGTTANPYRFLGQLRFLSSDIGIVFVGNKCYSPAAARWISSRTSRDNYLPVELQLSNFRVYRRELAPFSISSAGSSLLNEPRFWLFAAHVLAQQSGQDSPENNDKIRAKCKEYIDRSKNPASQHPKQKWAGSLIDDCAKAHAGAIIESADVRKQYLQLYANGCIVDIVCECCDSKTTLAYYSGFAKPTPVFKGDPLGTGTPIDFKTIGKIVICANNLKSALYASYIEHELVHANQHCYGINQGSKCDLSLKREMEAYFCQDECDDARSCLLRALASSCGANGYCNKPEMLSDSSISELVKWFEDNKLKFCTFPRTEL